MTGRLSFHARTARSGAAVAVALVLGLAPPPASASPGGGPDTTAVRVAALPRTGSAPTATYLVEARNGPVAARAAAAVTRAGGAVTRRYTAVLDGFAARLTTAQVRALRDPRGIRAVTADRKIIANPCLGCPPEVLQRESVDNWGLLRIGSTGPVTLEPQEPAGPVYRYDADGEGVTAVVLDSGVNGGGELAGRVAAGYDFVGNDANPADCSGHGTRVAQVVAGNRTGVADKTRIVPLRVFGCGNEGWWSNVVAALDWTLTHRPDGPTVVNLSGAGHAYPPGDRAVRATLAAGLPVVVSAGNVDDDACRYSPARVRGAVTVASSTIADARAPRSNVGRCVDLFAPGADIVTTSGTVSGTSFAAAHTTGAVARYLETHPAARPGAVSAFLTRNAVTGALTGVRGAPNRLLHLPAPVPPGAPGVTWSTDDATNTITATFTPPAERGSARLTAYGVCFTSDNDLIFPDRVCELTATADDRTLRLEGLPGNSSYEVAGFAVSKAGTGAFSPATALRLGQDPPTTPTVQPAYEGDSGGFSVRISSNDPPWAGFVEYTVTRTGGVDIWGQTTVTQVTSSDIVFFGGLVDGQSYTFTVQARNSVGSSEVVTVGPVEYNAPPPPEVPIAGR